MDCLFPRGLRSNCVCGLLGNGHDREVCTSDAGEEIVFGSHMRRCFWDYDI